ncbi:MAG: hypothetical protein U9R75_00180 [Candidatus Thermoplasmatota archaeon]|nr:hypothetical protein [Candidatus Thermoplasmatota archaeon]
MSSLLTIRLQEKEKEALALASNLNEMPVSKTISPFISEGVKISLGAVLIHRIDRSSVFRKDTYAKFIEIMMGPVNRSPQASGPFTEDTHEKIPGIIWNFFDLMNETKCLQRINSTLEDIKIEMDTTFVTPENLRSLCFAVGDSYLSFGGPLTTMNYPLANEIFFKKMLYMLYRNNARGTVKALSTQWYANQDMLSKLAGEMNDMYVGRTRSGVVEAIEVTGKVKKKRGRPARKKKALPPGSHIIAREID